MKKLILLLALLTVPLILSAQYTTPSTYAKSATSGNGTYYKNADTVYTAWQYVVPGIYTWGVEVEDSALFTVSIFQKTGFLAQTDFTLDSAGIAGNLLAAANDTTVSSNGKTKTTYNTIVTGKMIKFVLIFKTASGTVRDQKYKLFYGRQAYQYE